MNDQLPADKTLILQGCRERYLKQLVQLLQEGDRPGSEAIRAFQEGVGSYFDRMLSNKRHRGFEETDDLTASRISLVGETDLELEIRLGEFTARLQERDNGELWRVYLRFITLLEQPELTPADNPVGPKGIAEGLEALCRTLAEGHEKSLDRLERLENHFADNLTVLYTGLNEFLAGQAVDMAPPSLISAPSARNGSNERHANPAALLQQNLLGPQAAVFAAGMPAGSNASNTLFNQAMLDRLLHRLEELEHSPRHAAPSAATPLAGSPSLENLIPGLFNAAPAATSPDSTPKALDSAELGIPGGAPEAATIDTLAMIFEAIFASDALPESIKAILSSLQIPLLKAAMLDPAFFAGETHPARQVLDKMAALTIGLPMDTAASHPLCSRLADIASRLRHEFQRDMDVFVRHGVELDTLQAEQDATNRQLAARYQPLLATFERHRQAALRSRAVIAQHCPPETPAAIAAFLNAHWQRLLVRHWLQEGEQGNNWQAAIRLVEQLLWSIRPKADVDERKQLAKLLPEMLKQLNAGMNSLELPEAARNDFLDQCFVLQTAALRGASLPADKTVPATAAGAIRGCIEEDGLQLKTLDSPLSGPPKTAWRSGQWMHFRDAEQSFCGQYFPGQAADAACLLVNPARPFAFALCPAELGRQFSSGEARTAGNTSLFNTAAENALRQAPKKDVLT